MISGSLLRTVSTACVLLTASCSTLEPPTASVPSTVKRTQLHMGTLVSITAVAPTRQAANQAVETGFLEIKRLERMLSTWIPTSELSQVNGSAGKQPVVVSPETLTLVRLSLQIGEMTDGAFNIALGPAIEAWNVSVEPRLPAAAELEALKTFVDLRAVHADVWARTVFLERSGMRIDVGGIGKGYAADQAAAVMKKAGAQAGVVALAGDIKTFGRLPGDHGFPVGIRHPRREDAVLAWVDLQDEAISTAGDYERFFEKDGLRYHHILDPATLRPARGCQSVTVIAKDGVWADGLDTGVFVLGPERGMALIEHLDDIEAIIVDAEGRVHLSSGLRGRIRLTEQ